MTPGYPITLDLAGRLVLVVGLGLVGTRKAIGLVAAGARVVGVDPGPGVEAPTGVEHRAEPFRGDHLEGAALAFAAATPEVNRLVVAEARGRGVWVNAASDPELGDFALPATRRDGPVTLAVSTGGASPALARSLCDRAAGAIAGSGALAGLLAELRPIAIARRADPEARRRLLASWGEARWLDLLAEGGPGAVRSAWLSALASEGGGDSDLRAAGGMS